MTTTPEPLPSLPPSPGPGPESQSYGSEEDATHPWHEDEPSPLDPQTHLNTKRKGKGKERAVQSDSGQGSESESEDEVSGVVGYPPTKEEEAESRRVAENLRRWEINERQRRKAARESAALSAASGGTANNSSPSLFADLFRRDSRKTPLGRVGTHRALSTADHDGVPLADLDTLTLDRSSPPTPEPENPFDTPTASRTSLNIPAHSAIMSESDTVPDDIAGSDSTASLKVPQRPTLQASSSFAGAGSVKKKKPPPPRPLDLPQPRLPPLGDGPLTDRPLEAVSAPSTELPNRSAESEREDEERPVRWWHELLCGCGEGGDRGGDHQAGRTNPME